MRLIPNSTLILEIAFDFLRFSLRKKTFLEGVAFFRWFHHVIFLTI